MDNTESVNNQEIGVSPSTTILEPMSSSLEDWVLGVESTRLSQILMVQSAPSSPQSSIYASSQSEEMQLEPPTFKGLSCFVQDGNYLEPLSFSKVAPDLGFLEEYTSKDAKDLPFKTVLIAPKKRRAILKPPSGLKSMETFPLEVEQERIFNLSVPLLKKESGSGKSSKKRVRPTSATAGESNVPSVLWTPPEVLRPLCTGTMDPLAAERAALRKRKVWTLIGSLVQTLGGTDIPDKK